MRLKPQWRQSLVTWFKSRLRRKKWVVIWAFRSVSIVNLVARFIDWFL